MNASLKSERRRDFVILAAIHLVLLAALWFSLKGRFSENENYDYFCCYEPTARNLVEGRGFVYDNGRFADMYPPGYPLVIAAALSMDDVIGLDNAHKLIIAVCSVLSVLLLYAAVRHLGSRAWALAAGGLAASYPFFLWLGKQPNSETPFVPLLIGAFYCWARIWSSDKPLRWAAATGFLIGTSCLVRSIGVFAFVAFAGAILLAGRPFPFARRILLAAIILIFNIAAILPWEIVLYNTGGFALLGRNAGAGYLDGLTFGIQPTPPGGTPLNISPELQAFMQRAREKSTEVSTNKGMVAFVKSEFERSPSTVAEWMLLKLRRAWYANHSRRMESLTAAIQAVYLVLAAAGLWLLRRSHPAVVMAIVLLTLYFWAMATIVMPLMRYTVPVMVLLMIPVSATLIAIWNRFRPGTGIANALNPDTAIKA